MVASDSESLHGWWGSAAQPTHQAERGRLVIAGAFASAAPDDPALLVDKEGVRWFGPGIDRRQPLDHGVAQVEKAALWISAEDPRRWRAVFVGRDGKCASAGPGGELVSRDLWPEAVFGEVPWGGYTEIGNGRVDGFDCMVVWRLFEVGHGVCFVDPETLAPLRESLLLPRDANERWIDLVLANAAGSRSAKSEIAGAIGYSLTRWQALTRGSTMEPTPQTAPPGWAAPHRGYGGRTNRIGAVITRDDRKGSDEP